MDYIKAQQEILAAVLLTVPRGVWYHRDLTRMRTTFFHPSGFYAYVMPDKLVAVDVVRCKRLDRIPFTPCPIDDARRLYPTGVMVKQERRTLHEYKNCEGGLVYFNSLLLKKFGKDFQVYQDNELTPATLTEGEQIIGYICPVKYDPTKQ